MRQTRYMNFLIYGFEIVLGIVLIYYILSCCIYELENPIFKITFLSILIILIVFFAIYKIVSKKNIRHYNLLLFLFSFIIYTIWGIFAKTEPVSDYEVLLKGANSIVNRHF